MKKGKVCLLGAGPGDPELLTLKAVRRLQEADLIVYDQLANPAHLSHAKENAETICVGKGFRHKKISQDKINRLILAHARKGKLVVRLKGGDPYLFGRGGEEALYLVERGIPFEVIPGVTSANGCAAYAGIPLTHRDHNASVTFLTGHRAEDDQLDSIDWRKIVALNGTIVIYMGLYNLQNISEKLMKYGMAPDTPAAVIEWGTLPWQRSCDAKLHEIAAAVKTRGLKAPCMIIIGDVVRLRSQLNWYEKLPLFGKRILITRMREKAGNLSDKLTALGAWPQTLPVIRIDQKADAKAMSRAITGLREYDWIIFASTYGVSSFFEHLKRHHKDSRALVSAKIASVGCDTSQALRAHGIEPDLEPNNFNAQAMINVFAKQGGLKNKKALLLRTNIANSDLERSLQKLGAKTTRVTAYRTVPVKISPAELKDLLLNPPYAVTFTSSSSVSNFVRSVGIKNAKTLAKKCVYASIGPVTSKTLRSYGLKVGCQAKTYNTDGLVEALR